MPLYSNRFAGHLPNGDPRTPVLAAAGCPWPTIPPWRVEFSSTDATGQWEFLNATPVILEQVDTLFPHNWGEWQPIELPPEVYQWELHKVGTRDTFPEYEYHLIIVLIGWPGEVGFTKYKTGPCNTDIVWGNMSCPYGSGDQGETFTQYQVEFDKMRSPGYPHT